MKNDKLHESLAELQRQMVSLQDSQHRFDSEALANVTQVKIVQELLRGRRTVSRLVEEFHGLRKGDPEYSTVYSRIRKEVADLESRAIVSRRLFGRDRPYSLTQLGMERLTQLRGHPSAGVLSLPDSLMYAGALILGAICAGVIVSESGTGTPIILLAFVFFFVGGSAFSRLFRTLGRLRPISLPGDVEGTRRDRRGGETEKMWKPEARRATRPGRWTRMTLTAKVIGFGLLFGVIFLALGSVTLFGLGDGPTYVGIPDEKGAELPSDGRRPILDMTIDEYKTTFRLTDQEVAELAVLLGERDELQSQVDERLDEIRGIIGPGVHRLDAKKLSKQFDLTDEETTRLEALMDEWVRMGEELRDKKEEIMNFLASIGVIRAR